MNYPKISIITPSFNQGKFLEETINSVLSQNYPNLEYIIIDGGSSDNSVEIIKKYASKLKYWKSEKDNGQSEAINKGITQSTGEIISWLCSDDLYLPGALKKVAELFNADKDAVMIHAKSILFDENSKEKIIGAEEHDLFLRYFTVIPFPQPSSFFKRQLIEEQGMLDEKLHFAMDYDLLVRTALHYKIIPIKEIFSKYRLHRESKSSAKIDFFRNEWIQVFSKFIRSVSGSNEFIADLRTCKVYDEGSDRYNHNKNFSEEDLKKIVLYYLDFMAHLHYGQCQKIITSKILDTIKETDKSFYAERNLNSIAFRNKYIPVFLIRLMRKIVN